MYEPLRSSSPHSDDDEKLSTQRPVQSKQRWAWLLAIALSISVACNFILVVWIMQNLQRLASGRLAPPPVPIAEDFTGIVDSVPRTLVVFQNDTSFIPYDMDTSWAEMDDLVNTSWKDLMPTSRGFLLIDDHDQYPLPPPLTAVEEEVQVPNLYGMAVFHQIHCLELILRSYLAYQYGGDQPQNVREGHILHCFDYLRVALMCYGDTALEGADPGDDGLDGTQGWGVTHVCKDWDALYDMAVKRSAGLIRKGVELGIFHVVPSTDPVDA